jgi:hypothetical protein
LILHCGDLDKSGWTVKESLKEDLLAFSKSLGGNVEIKRILLNEDQVHQYGLSSKPVKSGLNKGNHGGGYPASIECQLEAMDMVDMQRIIRNQFELNLDMDLFNKQVEREEEQRRSAVSLWINRNK